ncbi:glycine cleavage system protein GcvH [Calorimonas adulescens]|uniref:Glycine cleavage system H protein n=1 Tax=Calorimonas adulescens TaxID=2606906 RepID=A0A5D8QCZ8_9THEO|nr:glycine cleavage system protein GcvH [Calorimonas adulescens]TZE82520.1 glycine cleavage system protein GcvH [Calorimonas adulescens]
MAEEYEVRITLYYTKEDTWARVMTDGTVRVGITDFAQKMLKEIVFVELPEVGSEVKQMQPFASAESIKSVSDIYSPISGKVKEVNANVIDEPSIINRDPYDAGWLVVIEPTKLEEELNNLLNADAYKALIKEKNR